jgi:hypothetical protein
MPPKAQTKATRKYNAKAYDRIELTIPKGDKEKLKKYLGEDKTINGFINGLIFRETNGIAGKGEYIPDGTAREGEKNNV